MTLVPALFGVLPLICGSSVAAPCGLAESLRRSEGPIWTCRGA
jgi:hypothetical protein